MSAWSGNEDYQNVDNFTEPTYYRTVLDKVQQFISLHKNKQTLGLIIVTLILAALPITVIVSQQQQEIRQRASEDGLTICKNSCYDAELEGGPDYPTDTCLAACDQQYVVVVPTTEESAPIPTPIPTPTIKPPQSLGCPTDCIVSSCGARGCSSNQRLCQCPEADFCASDSSCGPSPTATPLPILTPIPTPTTIVATSIPPVANCPLHNKGDANCDGKVDILDFNIWISEFTKELPSKNADFDGDGQVTINDFYAISFIVPFIKK